MGAMDFMQGQAPISGDIAKKVAAVRKKHGSAFPTFTGAPSQPGSAMYEIETRMIMAYLSWIEDRNIPDTEKNYQEFRLSLSSQLMEKSGSQNKGGLFGTGMSPERFSFLSEIMEEVTLPPTMHIVRECNSCGIGEVNWQSTDVNGPDAKFKVCGRCKSVFYCSRECQVKAWPTHKRKCKPHRPE